MQFVDNFISQLASNVYTDPKFGTEYSAFEKWHLSVTSRLNGIPAPSFETRNRLLESASILSLSADLDHKDAAYRIASAFAISPLNSEDSRVPDAANLILTRLGNFPAVDLLKSRIHVKPFARRLGYEMLQRVESNTIKPGAGRDCVLTDFQLRVWNELESGQSVAIAAPTSAGKSFVLKAYLEQLAERRDELCVIYLVPTRALLSQVAGDLALPLLTDKRRVQIVTTPIPTEQEVPSRVLFVVTQERLTLILANHAELRADLVIVDEAHAVADGGRGVLLTSVIDELKRRNADVQLLFAAPNISNPQAFGKMHSLERFDVVSSRAPVVSQNIFVISKVLRRRNELRVEALIAGSRVELGRKQLQEPIGEHSAERFATIANIFGSSGASLVYVNGPDACEKVALDLAGRVHKKDIGKRQLLSSFIAETIHPEYCLTSTVRDGVGMHYGHIPAVVRKAIEDEFNAGTLDTIVTTSTLLHGVNLPAQNLFLRFPNRGAAPLGGPDFWNLVGRAGRLGKEFEGNIYLIDYDDWKSKPLEERRAYEVRSALERSLLDYGQSLVKYIESKGTDITPATSKAGFEAAAVKLYSDFQRNSLDNTLERIGVASELRNQLIVAFQELSHEISLPQTIISQSPTVPVWRQESLFKRLSTAMAEGQLPSLLPVFPYAHNAYENLVRILGIAGQCLDGVTSDDGSHKYYALLALRWMQGEPIPRMVDQQRSHLLKRGESIRIDRLIRQILGQIEEVLRFKYVRSMACYVTILKYLLLGSRYSELIGSIPAIPTYLELGASKPAMLDLMQRGLSRYTARRIADLFSSYKNIDFQDWLARVDLNAVDISPYASDELRLLRATL